MAIYDLPLFDICQRQLATGKTLTMQEHHFWIFDRDRVRSHIHQDGARLIVHCRYAGAFLRHWNDWLQEIAEFYRTTELDSEMIFITADEFVEFQNIPKIHYHPFDCYHAYYYPLFRDHQVTDHTLIKKSLCLNKRGMLHRQLLYRAFYHYGLLEDSYFSYLCEKINRYDYILFDEETWTNIENRISQINHAHWPDILSMTTPPEKFITIPADRGIEEYRPWTQNGDWANKVDPTWNTDQYLLDTSFCSVITETSPDSTKVNLSEKTFRALALGHPALILGATGTVQRLRDMGFDMYDDVFDNSYDSIPDDIKRLAAFVESVRKIHARSLEDLDRIKKSLLPRRQANILVLKELHSQIAVREREIINWLADYFNQRLVD